MLIIISHIIHVPFLGKPNCHELESTLHSFAHAGSVRQFKQVLPDEKSLRDLGLKPGDRVWSLEGGRPMQTDADRMRESNGTS